MALALGFAGVVEEAPMERGVARLERLDHALARCGVWRIGNFWAALGEPFFLLEFHPLPRWITKHAVKATLRENLRERQMPVKELIQA